MLCRDHLCDHLVLVDATPRSAAAVAATDVVLLRWKKDAFQETLATNGRIAYQVSCSTRRSTSCASAMPGTSRRRGRRVRRAAAV